MVLFLLTVPFGNCQEATSLNRGEPLFQRGMNALRGSASARDTVGALDYFQQAAQAGYAPAQVVMGYFAETGTLVAREPQNAASQYAKAAEQNDRIAEWALGKLYFTGDAGTRDLNRADQWLSRAADQDDPFGAYLLGLVKLERQDYAAAADRFRTAAEQGLPQAQQQLALLLKDGRGIRENKSEAYVWLLLSTQSTAAKHPSTTAATNLNPDFVLGELEAALGSAGVELAKNKAREMETSVMRSRVAHGCTGWKGEFDAVPATPPPDIQQFCR
jgi:hypothetical protein